MLESLKELRDWLFVHNASDPIIWGEACKLADDIEAEIDAEYVRRPQPPRPLCELLQELRLGYFDPGYPMHEHPALQGKRASQLADAIEAELAIDREPLRLSIAQYNGLKYAVAWADERPDLLEAIATEILETARLTDDEANDEQGDE